MARDPVCGMNVREDKDINLKSEFRGQSYYFCSDKCRQEFDRNPASFVREDKDRNEDRNKAQSKDDRGPR